MKKERKTNQKKILIEYLENHKNQHLSMQEIANDLKDNMGMTTVYRIINTLIQKGIVTKIPIENKQGYCYMYNGKTENCHEHYHLICEKCNKLIHFESKQIEKVNQEAIENEEFEIDSKRVVFFGICKKCKENRSVENDKK